MEKNRPSLLKGSLYCFLEFQLATLVSTVATLPLGLLGFFGIGKFGMDILEVVGDILIVNLLVFWLFQRGPAEDADALRDYLPMCAIGLVLHLIVGLYPFATSVGISSATFARLWENGFREAAGTAELAHVKIWRVFSLFSLLKLGSSIFAFVYQTQKKKKKRRNHTL